MILEETREAIVRRNGKPLFTVTYRPESLTTALEARVLAPETTDLDVCRLLVDERVLVGWDLTEDDDETPVAVSTDFLAQKLGRRTVNAIFEAMREDLTPGKKSRTRSRDTYSETESDDSED